jgi:hypothetical protein
MTIMFHYVAWHLYTAQYQSSLCLLFADVTDKKSVDGPSRGSKKKRADIPVILHSYTTIMVHLAFTGSKANSHSHR